MDVFTRVLFLQVLHSTFSKLIYLSEKYRYSERVFKFCNLISNLNRFKILAPCKSTDESTFYTLQEMFFLGNGFLGLENSIWRGKKTAFYLRKRHY